MFFGFVVLITALAMAGTAAWFAIAGIVAVFSGAPLPALIMGAVIETGKVVGVSWLYQNHKEPTKIKYALAPLVVVAMLLTSMGIFGFLSKAHLEQTSAVQSNAAQIERLDQRISREQNRIKDAETVIAQLDETVQVLINYDKISGPDGARAVRANQQQQRDELALIIEDAEKKISTYLDDKLTLTKEVQAYELDVGPVKYIAELIYTDDADELDNVVRYVIIAFIFVFDPLAITLLMAANYTLGTTRKQKVAVDNTTDVDHEQINSLLKLMEEHNLATQDVEEFVEDVYEDYCEDEDEHDWYGGSPVYGGSPEDQVSADDLVDLSNEHQETEIENVAQTYDQLSKRRQAKNNQNFYITEEQMRAHSAFRGMENAREDHVNQNIRQKQIRRSRLLKD